MENLETAKLTLTTDVKGDGMYKAQYDNQISREVTSGQWAVA